MAEMRCMVVDDDPVSRDILKNCIARNNRLKLIATFDNAVEASAAIEQKNVDLVFLDVEMPEMTGLQFLEKFKDIPQVIMVTSEKKYAFEAFKYDVTDFLAKPVDMDRFKIAVDRAIYYEENVMRHREEEIFVKSEGVLVKLRTGDIEYVEAMGDYVKIVMMEGHHIVHSTMKAFEAKLPENFIRTHKSYIVNLSKVEEVKDNYVIGEYFNLPISRTHKKDLKERLNN
jgi:DNA-binding LytR/AlgR family response regulator